MWDPLLDDATFFADFQNFLQIDIVAHTEDDLRTWSGWCESRLRMLVLRLEGSPECNVRPWPFPYGTVVPPSAATADKEVHILTFFFGIEFGLLPKDPVTGQQLINLAEPIANFISMVHGWKVRAPDMQLVITHIKRKQIPEYVKKKLSYSPKKVAKKRKAAAAAAAAAAEKEAAASAEAGDGVTASSGVGEDKDASVATEASNGKTGEEGAAKEGDGDARGDDKTGATDDSGGGVGGADDEASKKQGSDAEMKVKGSAIEENGEGKVDAADSSKSASSEGGNSANGNGTEEKGGGKKRTTSTEDLLSGDLVPTANTGRKRQKTTKKVVIKLNS